MDITIYLPDELAKRAKDSGVNLSRMLRDQLTAQFAQEDAMTTTLRSSKEIILNLVDKEDRRFKGRFEGVSIVEASGNDREVFLTTDHDVIVYDEDRGEYWTLTDPESELREQLSDDQYIEAMDALGIVPTIDL